MKLVVDPELNSEAQVLAALTRLQVVVDRQGGFDLPSRDLELQDVDGDGEAELLYSEPVRERDSFPLLRLRAGAQASGSVSISARGLAGTQLAAVGGSVTADFVEGRSIEISVPLDLRPQYRAPRVISTLPQDGQDQVPSELAQIYVVFSKWVDPSTVNEHLRVHYQAENGSERVGETWAISLANVVEDGLPEQRTVALLSLSQCALSPGRYAIEADIEITDRAGTRLDQYPASPGPDPFAIEFSLPGSAGTNACRTATGCTDDDDCDTSEPPRFVCARQNGLSKCVPVPESCDGTIRCPSGYRCEEVEGQATCALDPFRCSNSDQCAHPDLLCAEEGPYEGQCVPAPPTCADIRCPAEGFECVEGEDGVIECRATQSEPAPQEGV